MSRDIEPFQCSLCGGTVVSNRGPGRQAEFERGVPNFEIPENIDVPRCNKCGELYLTKVGEKLLYNALTPLYRKWRAQHVSHLVSILTARHRIPLYQVSRLCGISHIKLLRLLNPDSCKENLTAVRLLEVLVNSPEQCKRLLDGVPMEMPCLR